MNQPASPSWPSTGLRRNATQVKLRAVELWQTYPREMLGAGLLMIVAAAAMASTQVTTSGIKPRTEAVPPAPPSMVVRPLAPNQALKLNSEIPVTGGPNPAAASFQFKGKTAARSQALTCLASAVYYEAGNQDVDGERAVAQVVLNRVRHPAFPGTICGVVYQGSTKPTGCQFTFTCDGSLNRRPDADGWRRAMSVAQAALDGSVYAPVGWATHYHADYVVPYWSATMAKSAVVGAHLFYHWLGAWGQPAVFTKTYAGDEPSASALRTAALLVPHIAPAYGQSQVAKAIKDIPGAEAIKLAPSLRGDKRVALRFNLTARTAAQEAPHEDYDKKFVVSDNLKWSLSGETVAQNEQPLGKPSVSPASAGSQR